MNNTIGHVTAHYTVRPGDTMQLTPGGVEWKITHIRADGRCEVVSPRGQRRTASASRAVTVNGARVVPEAYWVR